MAEITVVTTSWRLLDTNVSGVHAGACYSIAYPAAPYCEGAKTTNRLQSDTVPYDWRRCCVTSHCIVYPHKAVLQCIVKGKVVNLCLPSHGDLFRILHVVLLVLSLFLLHPTATWSTQGFVHIKFVIKCLHFGCFEIFSCWHPVDRLSILPSMHKITFGKRHLYVSVLFFSSKDA